jgi:cytochrome c peroxidase
MRGSVVQGSIAGRFGDRKPPTAAYATLTPLFSGGNNPIGGIFWDGRGTGHLLGNPAADQALGPFLNPVEQGLPDKACVVYRVLNGSYAGMYRDVWGGDPIEFVPAEYVKSVCEDPALPVDDHGLAPVDRGKVEDAYDNIARSLAAFEASLNRFSSLFDQGMLSPLAQEGQKLFSSKGKCQQCHENRGDQPVFTDFAFHTSASRRTRTIRSTTRARARSIRGWAVSRARTGTWGSSGRRPSGTWVWGTTGPTCTTARW